MMSKQIILCADDYGQNTEISEGILDLLAESRLSAVSCMVNGLAWQSYSKRIVDYPNISWGLHLNFTHGSAISASWDFSSLLNLLKKCYFPSKEFEKFVTQEIKAQLNRFKQDVGFWPQFIDGHQHVHQLPIIRQALINVVKELDCKPWFRITSTFKTMNFTNMRSWKKWALLILGGQSFQKLLDANLFSYPRDFAGEYSFHQAKHYRQIFLSAADNLKNGGLIMCHPGLKGPDSSDPIASSRQLEYQYFTSSEYMTDIKRLNISLL